jgi:hypothetical protein
MTTQSWQPPTTRTAIVENYLHTSFPGAAVTLMQFPDGSWGFAVDVYMGSRLILILEPGCWRDGTDTELGETLSFMRIDNEMATKRSLRLLRIVEGPSEVSYRVRP